MLEKNLCEVRQRIEAAAKKSGLAPDQIKLVAVTKTHGPDLINQAIDLGITDIGENKVQEICEKYAYVKPVNWHLIGHLQTNKVKQVIDKVCLIHSVDSIRLMDEIEKRAGEKSITAQILIQINISGEASKFGIKPEEITQYLEHAGTLNHTKIRGLMTVAPKCYDGMKNKLHFDNIRQIFIDIQGKTYDNVSMDYLSMGMSADFEAAIASGANMVRIGSAIFGAREYHL